MNNNYISHKGTITFFDDTRSTPTVPEGGAVYRRPNGSAWRSIQQIVGEFDTTPLDRLEYHDDN